MNFALSLYKIIPALAFRLTLFSLGSFLFTSCSTKTEFESPQGYDFTAPEKILLKEDLLEISGITFHGENDSLFAINDEDGKLFSVRLDKGKSKALRFAKAGDYEDIAVCNRVIFVLRSDGSLFSFAKDSIRGKKVTSVKHDNLLPKGEYESMYYHEADNKLYVLCKECEKEKKHISAFEIELNQDSITRVRSFEINTQSMREQYDLKWGFRASALARNNNGEWYILSSVNKLLMVTDIDWKIRKVYTLSPKTFIQPEGIAFDSYQNLYISNEGNETRNGNILKFKFNPEK
jgi:uncharacterized protein YjiK